MHAIYIRTAAVLITVHLLAKAKEKGKRKGGGVVVCGGTPDTLFVVLASTYQYCILIL
jgi:hypothetical protein